MTALSKYQEAARALWLMAVKRYPALVAFTFQEAVEFERVLADLLTRTAQEAREDALEEAARIVAGADLGAPCHCGIRRWIRVDDIAADVRSLKSKGTP